MRQTICVLAGVMLMAAGAIAQTPSAPAAAAPRPKLISPARGQVEVLVTRPASSRVGKMIVTTIRVQNKGAAPIAGLVVDEYWYDKGGAPVTGGTYRHKTPLMPNEIIDVRIETPSVPDMNRNSYQFKHANGTIKTTNVTKLDAPKKSAPEKST